MRRVDRVNLTHKRTHCYLKVFKRWWPCIWGLRSSGTFRYLLDCWYQKQYWTLYLQNTPGIPWLALQLLDLRERISPMQIYSVSSWFWHISHILFIRRKVTGHSAICYEGIWRSGIALFIFNPLSPELNPICYLLALLGAHHFLHVNRIRVKSLTLRLLMSYVYIYIYGAPILDVSRSHTTTYHSR
jgi:hypothetical protein